MIAVGVDTHKERHYAVALDHLGQMLAELVFAATAAGYGELQRWAEALAAGRELVFGIEGAGSWGAGLCEHLVRARHSVLEVERPRRRDRRAGKSDRIDAIAAAKRVLADESVSTPRRRGILTAMRALLIARRSAVIERTQVLNQLQALNATAPVVLRERIGQGTGKQLERQILSLRARAKADLDEQVVFAVMRDLPAHSRALGNDANRYRDQRRARSFARSDPARRAGDPPDLRRQAARLRSHSLQERGCVRALQRHRADPGLIRQDRPLPTEPRRRPPSEQRHPHDRDHTRQTPARDARLPRAPNPGRQDQTRSTPILKRHISRELYHRLAAIPLTS